MSQPRTNQRGDAAPQRPDRPVRTPVEPRAGRAAERAEEAPRADEVRLRALVEGVSVALWETDARGHMVAEAADWQRDTGQGPAEARGLGWLAAVHPEERAVATGAWHEALAARRPLDIEVRLAQARGGWRWSNLRAAPLRGPEGEALGWIGMTLDIADRRRAVAAQVLDARRNRFLATLGHELRNPLAAILSGIEVLRLAGVDGRLERTRAMMARSAAHLVRLVDDLLDVSRLGRNRIILTRRPIDLCAVVGEAVELQRDGRAGGRRIDLDLPAEPVEVYGDPPRLGQVLANLMDNAVKLTPADGHIRVRLGVDGERAVVTVADDGVGIVAEALPHIFELFVQGPSPSGQEPGPAGDAGREGLGIGLALARALVELHGGRVYAESPGPGQGSTFRIELPLLAPPQGAAPDPAGQAREARAGGTPPPRSGTGRPEASEPGPAAGSAALSGRGPAPDEAQLRTQPPGSAAAHASDAPRVLVVDDNPDAADSIRMLLELLGADVRVAYDGFAGVRLFERWSPSVVFTDLGMPRMDGFDLARCLRTAFPDRSFRLIAVSGWSLPEHRARTRAAGFDLHLAKPVDLSDLQGVLG